MPSPSMTPVQVRPSSREHVENRMLRSLSRSVTTTRGSLTPYNLRPSDILKRRLSQESLKNACKGTPASRKSARRKLRMSRKSMRCDFEEAVQSSTNPCEPSNRVQYEDQDSYQFLKSVTSTAHLSVGIDTMEAFSAEFESSRSGHLGGDMQICEAVFESEQSASVITSTNAAEAETRPTEQHELNETFITSDRTDGLTTEAGNAEKDASDSQGRNQVLERDSVLSMSKAVDSKRKVLTEPSVPSVKFEKENGKVRGISAKIPTTRKSVFFASNAAENSGNAKVSSKLKSTAYGRQRKSLVPVPQARNGRQSTMSIKDVAVPKDIRLKQLVHPPQLKRYQRHTISSAAKMRPSLLLDAISVSTTETKNRRLTVSHTARKSEKPAFRLY